MDLRGYEDLQPGFAPHRVAHVVASVPRTPSMAAEERDLCLSAVRAVHLDAGAQLSCGLVAGAAAALLRIPAEDIRVSPSSTATYTIRLPNASLRASALAPPAMLQVSGINVRLFPWTRHVNAAPLPATLLYRARVCLEGVPDHAMDVNSVRPIFSADTIIEGVDDLRPSRSRNVPVSACGSGRRCRTSFLARQPCKLPNHRNQPTPSLGLAPWIHHPAARGHCPYCGMRLLFIFMKCGISLPRLAAVTLPTCRATGRVVLTSSGT